MFKRSQNSISFFKRAGLIVLLFTTFMAAAQLQNANWYSPENMIITFDLNGIKSITGISNLGLQTSNRAPSCLSDSNGVLLFREHRSKITYVPRNIVMNHSNLLFTGDYYEESYIFQIPTKKNYIKFDNSSTYNSILSETADTSNAYPLNNDIYIHREIDTESSLLKFGTAIGSDNCHGLWLHVINNDGTIYLGKIDSSYQSTRFQKIDLLTSSVLGTNPRLIGAYELTISSNGKRLAIKNWNYIYIFDFDAVSGKATIYKRFDANDLEKLPNNVSNYKGEKFNIVFSPNAKYLYIFNSVNLEPNPTCKPHQFDVETGLLYKISDNAIAQGKIAIDGRMYTNNFGSNTLGIIYKPDLPCPACDYRENEIDTLQSPVWFFPNTVENYYGRKYDFKISQTCIGDSVLFEGPKMATDDKYIWHFADGFTTTAPGVKRHISQEQKIHLRYNYCDVYDTAYVPPAKPLAISDTFLCAKNTLLLPPKTEAVLINNKTISGVVTINNGTNYALLANECFTVNDTFKVEILQRQAKPFGTDTVICHQTELMLQAKTPSDYSLRWSDNSNQKEVKVTESGRYSLIRSNRCFVDTSTINVTFVAPTDISKISNVITPNGDGINDTWLPAIEPVSNYERSIFNRWGTLVHQTTEISEPWTAQSQADGIYFWHISYTDCNNQTQSVKGTVMVVR